MQTLGIRRSRVGENGGEPGSKSSRNEEECPRVKEVTCKLFQQSTGVSRYFKSDDRRFKPEDFRKEREIVV